MKRRTHGDYTHVSPGIIRLLTGRGMNLTQIAQILGVTKSYISRVNAGDRGLTLDHIAELQRKTCLPIPLMLMESINISTVPKDMRPLYRMVHRMCKQHVAEISVPRRKRTAKKRAA
jgi:predicted transcriptional regulator